MGKSSVGDKPKVVWLQQTSDVLEELTNWEV